MMNTIEQYLRQVRNVLDSVSEILTSDETAEVEYLIDHDECPEALRTLAWIIVDENKRVSRKTIEAIRTLTSELIDDEHMPSNLEDFIVQ